MIEKPNILFILSDQLRASSLPMYDENQIDTPNLNRLCKQGVKFTNAFSSCPVCTPYRSMLLTGRYPQTTGHLTNFIKTRHDEISIGDAFKNAGYKTAWIGKWHLHTGSFPNINGKDYVPEGRDRLGFDYWRGYNFHMDYFNGWVNKDNWECEQWNGYETFALNQYAFQFLDNIANDPFCMFISPHQPHATFGRYVPYEYIKKVPKNLSLPENVSNKMKEESLKAYRNYLAMIIALDDMVGNIMDFLERKNLRDNTILIFTSDHGTQMGSHGWQPWQKMVPYEESINIPFIVSFPGLLNEGKISDSLISPVDIFPTLCKLSNIPIPRTIEGRDLSDALLLREDAFEQDELFMMNFTSSYDYLKGGQEWRGLRTKTHSYFHWLGGRVELYDIEKDPFQKNNIAKDPQFFELGESMRKLLDKKMKERKDELIPCNSYNNWFDSQRRVVRNACGILGDPEDFPNWSLLE